MNNLYSKDKSNKGKNFNKIDINNSGFSFVELAISLAIISSLSAITIPNVLTYLKLSKIDEAKSLMSVFASECLQAFRIGQDINNFQPESLSNERLDPLGFSIYNQKSECKHVSISPKNVSDDLFFRMDFRVSSESGKIFKYSSKPAIEKSINICKSWAGKYCGATNADIQSWIDQLSLDISKSECDADLQKQKETNASGKFFAWDKKSNKCNKQIWIHNNYVVDSASKYEEIKNSENCSKQISEYSTYSGEKYLSSCSKTFYFFKGQDLRSEDLMKSKLLEDEESSCKVNREVNRLSGINRKFLGEIGPGTCGDTYWVCNQRILTSIDKWNSSSCYSE